ncbi:hypothetical protein [Aurantiacibacter sediminis]|uniref:Uncharacterized protein n=1 Tax=Aurantiacibacter sediminis TaxID=2793064 RepID=A0ABS0N5F3_9SPHN|nr:hypothetical protein [Aurantiacibacter sediminis]MBH5323025.1 hypothetical protein [Aurantiacibacter sediminis]
MSVSDFASHAMAIAIRVKGALQPYRKLFLAVGLALFSGGIIYFAQRLDVSLADLNPLAISSLFALAVLSMIYSAISMKVLAKGASVELSLLDGIRINAVAQMAELLPIPGGAIVRTGALMQRGTGLRQSGELVIASSLLWVTLAGTAGALALTTYHAEAWIAALALAGASLVLAGWLALHGGVGFALWCVALRIFGVSLTALRLLVAFWAIGMVVPPMTGFVFSFATIAGTASAVVPTGIGVGESLAALLALPIQIAPGAAFLATGLNRLVGLILNGACALAFVGLPKPTAPIQPSVQER